MCVCHAKWRPAKALSALTETASQFHPGEAAGDAETARAGAERLKNLDGVANFSPDATGWLSAQTSLRDLIWMHVWVRVAGA